MEKYLRKNTRWSGRHKGVVFEIQNFKLGDRDQWAFYLLIPLEQVPEEVRERLWLPPQKQERVWIHYDYYGESLIYDIRWHGGCTFYEKHGGFDGHPRLVKMGCDYGHLWDEGHEYNVSYVEMEARDAVDSFLEMVPGFKFWCCGNGKLYSRNEGRISEDGSFMSEEYWKDKPAWERAEA